MRISAKGRYALAALIEIARQTRAGEIVSVVSIAEKLGVSKIFLEQAMALLKKSNIIQSTKGARGGYQLARPASQITVREALTPVENALFEQANATVAESAQDLEAALKEMVFDRLDRAVETTLSSVSVQALLDCAERQASDQSFMPYL